MAQHFAVWGPCLFLLLLLLPRSTITTTTTTTKGFLLTAEASSTAFLPGCCSHDYYKNIKNHWPQQPGHIWRQDSSNRSGARVIVWQANDDASSSQWLNLQQQQQQQQEQHSPPEIIINEPHPYRSISDYMGGHHAGKFDFDPRICGVTSLNYEKSIVFDDCTTSSSSSSKCTKVAPLVDEEDSGNGNTVPPLLPKWATTRPIQVTTLATIRIGETVTVRNEELSWEPFYATIERIPYLPPPPQQQQQQQHQQQEHQQQQQWSAVAVSQPPSDENSPTAPPLNPWHFQISPMTSGKLAPRGGSAPYSDSCVFAVIAASGGDATAAVIAAAGTDGTAGELGGFRNESSNDQQVLVVRTEQDMWTWRIIQ